MSRAFGVFESIFGKSFWDNMVTEFTFWGFSKSEMRKRYRKLCTEDFRENECQDSDSGSGMSENEYHETFEPSPEIYKQTEVSSTNDDKLVCTLMMATSLFSTRVNNV